MSTFDLELRKISRILQKQLLKYFVALNISTAFGYIHNIQRLATSLGLTNELLLQTFAFGLGIEQNRQHIAIKMAGSLTGKFVLSLSFLLTLVIKNAIIDFSNVMLTLSLYIVDL